MLRAMSRPEPVLIDPAAAYPQVGELRAAIARRDWAGTRAVIESAPADARCLLVREGSDVDEPIEGFLREQLRADPDDSLAGAMLGTHLIGVGWKVRTRARAQQVSREQFATFHGWLRQAEQVLIDTAARTPAEPAAWVARLTSARGLQLGLAESRRRYDRLRAIDPNNYAGQRQFLQRLCPKWSGSWELLHGWTREELAAAPPGSLAGALVAEAHIEHWLDVPDAEEKAYLSDPAVRTELLEAAGQSIWHADFARPTGWVHAASCFAMMFSLVGDQEAAARTFAQLGDLGSASPWDYLGDPQTVIAERRARAGAVR
jgi:hypothetical protein